MVIVDMMSALDDLALNASSEGCLSLHNQNTTAKHQS